MLLSEAALSRPAGSRHRDRIDLYRRLEYRCDGNGSVQVAVQPGHDSGCHNGVVWAERFTRTLIRDESCPDLSNGAGFHGSREPYRDRLRQLPYLGEDLRRRVSQMNPNPDYDASDELEYGIASFAWLLRGNYPPPSYAPDLGNADNN